MDEFSGILEIIFLPFKRYQTKEIEKVAPVEMSCSVISFWRAYSSFNSLVLQDVIIVIRIGSFANYWAHYFCVFI